MNHIASYRLTLAVSGLDSYLHTHMRSSWQDSSVGRDNRTPAHV
jgi:hypothetical protein